MEGFEKHNINDFFKDSLKDYEAPYNPEDWLDMEKKLDGSIISGEKGRYTKSIISGSVVIGIALTAWLLLDTAEKPASNGSESDHVNDPNAVAPFNKLTRIKLNDNTITSGKEKEMDHPTAENAVSAKENQHPPVKGENATDPNRIPADKPSGNSDYLMSQPEGPILDMLRREHQTIEEMDAPKAVISTGITSGCIPFTTRFNPGNKDIGTRYLWDFGDGFFSTDASPSHTYFNSGVYTVSLTVTSIISDKSRTVRQERMISAFKVPEANFELLRDNNNGSGLDVTFIDQSINVVEWLWYFGDFETATNKNPSHNYSESGDYKVTLIGKNADGCYDTTIGHISVSKHIIGNNIYTPTAFSPNGDGVNDEFKPVIVGNENQPYEMTIYDRNGLVVFETNDINKGWDGKIGEGELAPFGTYIWLVIVKDGEGREQKRLGQVTLLK